jgi:hypothetical protein
LLSIDSFTPAARSGWVNSALVNWQPWSVLKISGLPCAAIAWATVRTQNEASSVLDSSHASTHRLCQSITAHR